ncbi:cytochrome P450 [Sordaria brevicollis]|uniref:Cytochrome P450 n=1 Tax=Sordaria brevicollis TaxID=83679 RepID=A0AAE0PM57_SORBR|nr:cytochrome P450 [Sordaria brevicollis]
MASILLYALTALFLAVLFKIRNVGIRPKDLPPGPPTKWLLGNLLQMPKEKAYLQFKKWADEYGPIYTLILGTQTTIVLTDAEIVKELLDKRSGIYSSRAEAYLSRVASKGLRMAGWFYGDQWRRARKILHSILNMTSSLSFRPYQDLENLSLLAAILDDAPSASTDAGAGTLFSHFRRTSHSLATSIFYGFRIQDSSDPRLLQMYQNLQYFSDLNGAQAAALLDVYPVLRHLQRFLPIYRHAREVGERTSQFFLSLWMPAKAKVLNGTSQPCFAISMVKAQEQGITDEEAAFIIGNAGLEAASDTTSSTLAAFIMGVVMYPEVQRRLQAVVDEITEGGKRMPELGDLEDPRAQYIRACAKESLRWMPTGILGVPHAVIRDDEFRGWRIPRGASVVLNIWGINTDEKRYADPHTFNPDRFLHDTQTSSKAALNPDVSQRDHYTFGAGRRICQGLHVADDFMFLSIARLMWAFNFDRAVDPDTGEEIVPDRLDLIGGLLVQPAPFKMRITPRSEKRAQMVREKWREVCEEKLDGEMQWRSVPGEMYRVFPSMGEVKA